MKEKRRTFDSRAQILCCCCCCAKRAPAPNSSDLSDLNKKLLQYVSLCFQLQRDAIRDLYMWMHTQMFYSKGLIFLSFTSLCSDLSRSRLACMHVLMNVKRALQKSSKISRETVGINSFDLAMRLAQITSVKSLKIDVKWRRIEHGC